MICKQKHAVRRQHEDAVPHKAYMTRHTIIKGDEKDTIDSEGFFCNQNL
jgi:hypothetical protein